MDTICAFVLASKKINLAHVSTTNSFHRQTTEARQRRAMAGFLVTRGRGLNTQRETRSPVCAFIRERTKSVEYCKSGLPFSNKNTSQHLKLSNLHFKWFRK